MMVLCGKEKKEAGNVRKHYFVEEGRKLLWS